MRRDIQRVPLQVVPFILRPISVSVLATIVIFTSLHVAPRVSAHAPGLAVTLTNVQVLELPEIGIPPIATLAAGTTVALTGDVAPGFVQVAFDGGSGWVDTNLLSVSGRPGIEVSIVTSRTLILDAPFPGAEKLGTLDPGDAVMLTGAVVGEYAAASSDGVGGWVNRADLGPTPLE